MGRTALTIALSTFCFAMLSSGQEFKFPPAPEPLNSLRQRAEQGDPQAQCTLGQRYQYGLLGVERDYAEALRWYRKAAEQGDSDARSALGGMYFSGDGVEQDYAEAARWYRCPNPSRELLAGCAKITSEQLPEGAIALLDRLKCTSSQGAAYDEGSAVDLNGDGSPEYLFCCDEPAHGPCNAVLIGKVGTQWKDLTARTGGVQVFYQACFLFLVLESRHGGFHDICLANACSTASARKGQKPCVPMIWRYSGGQYRELDTTRAIAH